MPRYLTLCLLTFLLADQIGAAELTGTLKRIADTGKFRIGYVPDAPPMSFVDDDGTVVGYSIDLCRRIASAVQDALGLRKLRVSYVPLVAPEERLRAVEQNTVDIECGATTVTLSRRERVDFTLMTFITGGSVLSLNTAPISSTIELADKTIAVIAGTTTDAALRLFMEINEFELRLEPIATHDDGLRLLDEGKVDGYASDRAMLIGQVLQSPDAADYTITSDVFSFEPYALMLERGDTDFRLLADRALAGLYSSARIQRLYHDWFGRYGVAMPPIVEAMYEFQAVAQ